MKKLFKVFAVALVSVLAIGMTACNNGIIGGGDSEIIVSPEELDFPAEGATKTITVTGEGWSATASDSWIEITENTGSIDVTLEANSETSPRSGYITVTTATDHKTIAVNQEGAEPAIERVDFPYGYLDCYDGSLRFGEGKGYFDLYITEWDSSNFGNTENGYELQLRFINPMNPSLEWRVQ